MKIEDCQTVNEFFGVEQGDHIWIEGERYGAFLHCLGGSGDSAKDGRALVGCLTGQLKWSKTEPIPEEARRGCKYCEGRTHTNKPFSVTTQLGATVEAVFNYCPICGSVLEREPMTDEEENILREIAAWFPSWQTLRLEKDGDIGMFTGYKYINYYFGLAAHGSKAYTVLAPILEKHGEINLDDYRG